jgi:hypothetical protein
MVRPMVRGVIGSPFGGSSYHDGISYSAETGRVVIKAVGAAPTITTLTSAFTFTGGNQSMYMGPAGLLVASATNTPRIEYDATGNCLGLLMEASRTNLWLRSQEASDAQWVKLRSSVSANTVAAPDGTTTADTIVEDGSAAATHLMRQDLNVTSGTTYTATFWVKAAGRTQVSFQFGSENACFAFEAGLFTLSGAGTAATLSGSPLATSIQAFPNGWYRCRVSATAAATALAGLRVFLAEGGTTTYNGDSASGVYFWGAQFEAGAFPSSYIPTTTASVARTADSCIRTLGSEFSATAGTVVVAGRASGGQDAADDQFVYVFDDDTLSERVRYVRLISSNVQRFQVSDGGASQVALSENITNNTAYKAAMAWAANDFALSQDGLTVQTDVAGTLPTVTRLRFGYNASGVSQMNGHIRRFDYWPSRLSNGFLQSASA